MTFPLLTYLNAQQDNTIPEQGSLPTKQEWVDFTEFHLKGTRLCFSDSWCPFDGVGVALPSGTYSVKALCVTYGFLVRVAALRAELNGTNGALGECVGEFAVDVGAVGITDIDLIESLSEESYEKWIEAYSYAEEHPAAGIHPCPEIDSTMLFTDCGWGDGVYSVFEIKQDGKVVGAEATFIERNEPCPIPYKNSKNEYDCLISSGQIKS
jgi:hypothetical protein